MTRTNWTRAEIAELFDLPFISADPDLVGRVGRDAEYKQRLIRELTPDARARGRKR